MGPPGLWKFLYWPISWAISLGFPVMAWPYRLSGPTLWMAVIVGMALTAYALLLHFTAGRTLKLLGHERPGTGIWPDKLVVDGIYSCMRHPQHLGLTMIPVGLALMTGYPAAIMGSGWAVASALAFVLIVEEPDCFSRFKADYYRYLSSTPAFTLSPSCLSAGLRLLRDLRGDED